MSSVATRGMAAGAGGFVWSERSRQIVCTHAQRVPAPATAGARAHSVAGRYTRGCQIEKR